MRRVLLTAVLFSAALILCGGGAAAHRPQAHASAAQRKVASPPTAAGPASADGAAATPKVTEIKEDGLKKLLESGARQGRPLLVNFWATWCTPCREEFPDLVKLRGRYAADRLDFVLVSLDDVSDIDKVVPDFLREMHVNAMPAYLLHADDDGSAINLVDQTWHGELPATYLYDRAGKLVYKHTGRVKPDELRAAVEQALNAKPQEAFK
jgi:thiol-disulfide isomerase/thioredoxin